MAGCPKCAVDLVRANPQKPAVTYPNGFVTFRDLRAGERLNLPDKWFNGTLDDLPKSYFEGLADMPEFLGANQLGHLNIDTSSNVVTASSISGSYTFGLPPGSTLNSISVPPKWSASVPSASVATDGTAGAIELAWTDVNGFNRWTDVLLTASDSTLVSPGTTWVNLSTGQTVVQAPPSTGSFAAFLPAGAVLDAATACHNCTGLQIQNRAGGVEVGSLFGQPGFVTIKWSMPSNPNTYTTQLVFATPSISIPGGHGFVPGRVRTVPVTPAAPTPVGVLFPAPTPSPLTPAPVTTPPVRGTGPVAVTQPGLSPASIVGIGALVLVAGGATWWALSRR